MLQFGYLHEGVCVCGVGGGLSVEEICLLGRDFSEVEVPADDDVKLNPFC